MRLGLAVVVATLIPAAPAASAPDEGDPPQVDTTLQFVTGGIVEIGSIDRWGNQWTGAPAVWTVTISETPPSSAATWYVDVVANSELPCCRDDATLADGEINAGESAVTFVYEPVINNYDGWAGGEGQIVEFFEASATNHWPVAGDATTTIALGGFLHVVQHDDPRIETRRRWVHREGDEWLGGSIAIAKRRGARIELNFDAVEGQVVALVVAATRTSGEARVKLDGENQGRVDTHSPRRVDRLIVWQSPPLEAGPHTIEVINLGTPERPRLLVDAILLTEGRVAG